MQLVWRRRLGRRSVRSVIRRCWYDGQSPHRAPVSQSSRSSSSIATCWNVRPCWAGRRSTTIYQRHSERSKSLGSDLVSIGSVPVTVASRQAGPLPSNFSLLKIFTLSENFPLPKNTKFRAVNPRCGGIYGQNWNSEHPQSLVLEIAAVCRKIATFCFSPTFF